MSQTEAQYLKEATKCKALFEKKMVDYGCAWRILRTTSLTDQIFIKAQRIRTLQEVQTKKVDEGEEAEFIGIVNYCIMALIQLELGVADQPDLTNEEVMAQYCKHADETKALMERKNHDYGEAWRDMRVSSLTDLILQKLLRVKQIEDNQCVHILNEQFQFEQQQHIPHNRFLFVRIEIQSFRPIL